MKIVFMGTPDFAVPCLRTLAESGHDVAAVFTQPDKPKGRGYKMIPTPVKAAALEYGLPIYQPLSLRKGEDAEEAMKVLRDIAPELIVVTAYGQILPKEILDLPKYGCIYRNRLYKKLSEVLEGRDIDEQRVLTEAAIFAEKIAVDEETVRLRSHISLKARFFHGSVYEFDEYFFKVGLVGIHFKYAETTVDAL